MRHRGRVIAAVVLIALLLGATLTTVVRVTAAPPTPTVQVDVPATYQPLPGPAPPVYQPPQGAMALQGDGENLALLDADTPHPIASVAKALTAYAVLQAHPLSGPDDQGPTLTMTDVDVADYQRVIHEDGSSLPVVAGERLSERQLLLGLLLPSANNFADTLGRWVAGSVDQFVTQLNQTALRLGMSHTHFVDPSGFDPGTVSSASDLVILGTKLLQVPALAALVATQHAQLPDGTRLDNLDTLLDTEPGWLGIKTGNTEQAGGCLLFAARRPVGDGSVTVVGAVLGQVDLHAALDAAKTAVDSAYQGYGLVNSTDVPPMSGRVTTRWGDQAALAIPVGVGGEPITAGVPVRLGTVFHLKVSTRTLSPSSPAGTTAGVINGDDGTAASFHWALIMQGDIKPPSFWWMLFLN